MRKIGSQIAPNPNLTLCGYSVISIFEPGRARCTTQISQKGLFSDGLRAPSWLLPHRGSQLAIGLGVSLWVVISTISNFNPGCHRLGNRKFQRTFTLSQDLRCFPKSSSASQTWACIRNTQKVQYISVCWATLPGVSDSVDLGQRKITGNFNQLLGDGDAVGLGIPL